MEIWGMHQTDALIAGGREIRVYFYKWLAIVLQIV
jgi:hypothetical protein